MKASVLVEYFENGTFKSERRLHLTVFTGKNDERCVFVPGFQGAVKVWWDDEKTAWRGKVDLVTRKGC